MEWNRTITVTKDPDGKSGFVSLSIDDLLFFRQGNKQLEAHTAENVYYLIGGEVVKKLLEILRASGYIFARSDRDDIPDVGKIREFNQLWSRAYFTDSPKSDSKFVYIARKRYGEFVEYTARNNEYIHKKMKSQGHS